MTEQSPWVRDTTAATFEADVVQRSLEVPVVVDFWADWCQPCRQLTPILERLANEYNGKFALVRVNVDQSPDIASAFGVQSIPHVFAIRDGQPVNHFQGLLPEDQVREWLASFLPSPAEELVKAAMALEESDPAAAEAKYREAAQLDPDNAQIKIQLARVLLARNREHECLQVIEKLEERGYLEPEAERIKSQLEILTAGEEAGGVEEARKAAEAAPDDPSLQIRLVDALAAARQYEEAFEICLRLIEQDKTGVGVEAKEMMVKIFEMLGSSSELVSTYRRRLATLLY